MYTFYQRGIAVLEVLSIFTFAMCILGIKRIFPCTFENKRMCLLTHVYGMCLFLFLPVQSLLTCFRSFLTCFADFVSNTLPQTLRLFYVSLRSQVPVKAWLNNFAWYRDYDNIGHWFTEVTSRLQCDVAMFFTFFCSSTMKLEGS